LRREIRSNLRRASKYPFLNAFDPADQEGEASRVMNFHTPVAFFIFNRPRHTARVFSRIAEIKPSRLLIIADGPRDEFDRADCEAGRAVVADVGWDCDVYRNYSDTHLGCRRRMSGGLDWVFSLVQQAIVLEDDCLPDATFFPYCDELLKRYEDNDRVMTVSGDNFQFGVAQTPFSYYFSTIHHLWGWATWRRAWVHHDPSMLQWPRVADTDFPGDSVPPYAAEYHKRKMAQTFAGMLDAFSYEWILTCWLRHALCALPAMNLVSNIGFGSGVHGTKPHACSALPTKPLSFPLRHPPEVGVQQCAKAA
jgi:hypothetical protein